MRAFKLFAGGAALIGLIVLGALYPVRALAIGLGAQPRIRAVIVAKTGDTVRLFHGGTEEARKLFCKGETVPVYRYYSRYRQTKEVGKVKLGEFVGDHYIDGTVIEGEVGPGDTAMKGSAACLVVNKPAEP